MRVEWLCRLTDEQHRDRDGKQNNRKMGEEEDRAKQDPGPADCAPGLPLVLEHAPHPEILKRNAGLVHLPFSGEKSRTLSICAHFRLPVRIRTVWMPGARG